MKKPHSLLLALVAVFSLCACKAEKNSGGSVPGTSPGQAEAAPPSISTEAADTTVSGGSTQPSNDGACVHLFSLEYLIEATCSKPGHTYAVCEYCGEERYEEIPAIPHSFGEAACTQAKTCAVCGATEGDALGHSYTGGKCDRCGANMPGYEEKPSGCNHNYQISQQAAPTCTEKGSFTYICSTCGDSYTEVIDPKGHKYADATCDKPQTCTVCSATTGAALGHSYSSYRCTRCGAEDPNKPTAFTVTVRSDQGKVIAGVTVTVYVDGSATPAGSSKTGSNGKATIPMEAGSSYKVVLSDIPAEFEAKESYRFKSMTTNITLKTIPVRDPLDHSKAQYKVGDTMVEFTMTDIDGNTYKLSQLLQEKKIVVLNFWYCACSPCKAEFPYFNAFYQANKDKVELLAMTPYDTADKIRDVRQEMELMFPVLQDTLGMNQGFEVTGYPTTVVITADGVIRMIKVNGFKSEQELTDCLKLYL